MPRAGAETLLEELGGGWELAEVSAGVTGLRKKYAFKNFSEALDFVNRVGAVAEGQGHHPDIALSWGSVTVDSAAAGSITGSVRNTAGQPLASARVSLSGPQHASTQSDATGVFHFNGLAPGTYTVTASAGGYIAGGIDGIAVNENVRQIALVLESATFSTLKQIAEVHSLAGTFNDSPSAMTILNQQRFADIGQIQIGHVLDQIPGVVSARPASADAAVPGSITSPNLRGALDYEKATLLDGRPLINGRNGDYPTMLVNSLLFDSIEIIEGPTAYAPQINYGIGGTLNFRTGDPTQHRTTRAVYGFDNMSGSFAQLRLSDTIANGRLGYLFTFASNGSLLCTAGGHADRRRRPFGRNDERLAAQRKERSLPDFRRAR